MKDKSKRLALVPALLAALIDISLTIGYQSEKYWQGDLSAGNEGNPIGGFLMEKHVSGIFLICGIWLIIIWFAGYYLPEKVRKVFLLFVVIAHSWGASTWIYNRFDYWAVIVLFIINATVYISVEEKLKKSGS